MSIKIPVLQVEDATFKPYHYWSDWIDVFTYRNVSPYLVQMKISRMNGKKFRSVSMISSFYAVTVSAPTDLLGHQQEQTK